jgi:hypothetical protein
MKNEKCVLHQCGYHSCFYSEDAEKFVFWRPAIFTNISRGFSQSLQANAKMASDLN